MCSYVVRSGFRPCSCAVTIGFNKWHEMCFSPKGNKRTRWKSISSHREPLCWCLLCGSPHSPLEKHGCIETTEQELSTWLDTQRGHASNFLKELHKTFFLRYEWVFLFWPKQDGNEVVQMIYLIMYMLFFPFHFPQTPISFPLLLR